MASIEVLLAEAKDHLDAADAAEDHRWEAARLMAEAADAGAGQRMIAETVGRAQTTVRLHVAVWRRFGEFRGTQSWSEAYDHVRGGKTSERLRDAHIEQEFREPEAAAAFVEEQLARPDVQEHLRNNPSRRTTIVGTAAQIDHDARQKQTAGRSKPLGGPMGGMALFTVHAELLKARRLILDQLRALRDIDLDDEYREILLGDVADLEGSIDWMRSYLNSGDRSMDEQLETLLRGGGTE